MSRTYDLFQDKPFSEPRESPVVCCCRPLKCKQSLSGVCINLRACSSSLCCESAVVTLTLVSVLAITGEMLIDFGFLTAPSSQSQSQQQPSPSVSDNDTGNGGLTAASDSVRELELVQAVFHYTSLTIAALFFLEIIMKLLIFRKKFLVKIWQMLDVLVVVAAVVIELVFEIKGRIPELEACSFVIIFRLWRLPHMCNIKAEALRRDMEQDLEVWKASKNKLEDRWHTLQAKYDKQKEQIEYLEQEVLALKRERKARQNQFSAQSSCITTATYDHVPAPRMEDFRPSQHVSDYHMTEHSPTNHSVTCHFTTDSKDEDRTTGKTDMEDEGERTRERHNPTEEQQPNRTHLQSDRERCLPVHVQIEGQNGFTVGMVSQGIDDNQCTNTSQQPEPDDLTKESARCYDNKGFSPDQDQMREEFLHDEDDPRTYTTAEGIPMTDL